MCWSDRGTKSDGWVGKTFEGNGEDLGSFLFVMWISATLWGQIIIIFFVKNDVGVRKYI